MKTHELIAQLQALIVKHPEVAELRVQTEGCDCWGDIGACLLVPNGLLFPKVLLLARPDGDFLK